MESSTKPNVALPGSAAVAEFVPTVAAAPVAAPIHKGLGRSETEGALDSLAPNAVFAARGAPCAPTVFSDRGRGRSEGAS